jgi:hypothetical protein
MLSLDSSLICYPCASGDTITSLGLCCLRLLDDSQPLCPELLKISSRR